MVETRLYIPLNHAEWCAGRRQVAMVVVMLVEELRETDQRGEEARPRKLRHFGSEPKRISRPALRHQTLSPHLLPPHPWESTVHHHSLVLFTTTLPTEHLDFISAYI
jgi:hypothetical protein